MKNHIVCTLLLLGAAAATAQNWTGYPAGSLVTPYVNGSMTAVVTRVNTTMNSGTPMFTTSTSPDCYIAAGSLALNAGFFNSYLVNASRIVVDISFSTGGLQGICASAAFTIRDINSGESFTDFLDVVEISGIDGNNAAIPAANITIGNPANTNVVTVGAMKKIVGHNSSSELTTGGPYFSTPCNLTSVSVAPPVGVPLRSIRILYRPAVGTSSGNAYFSVGIRPAVQYISISNLTMTATGGGCVVVPATAHAFRGTPTDAGNVLSWESAVEDKGLRFLVERSEEGSFFDELVNVNGDVESPFAHSCIDPAPAMQTYYRLSSHDANGTKTILSTIHLNRESTAGQLFTMYPNPVEGPFHIQTLLAGDNLLSVHDHAGKTVLTHRIEGVSEELVSLDGLAVGLYFVRMSNKGQRQVQSVVLRR